MQETLPRGVRLTQEILSHYGRNRNARESVVGGPEIASLQHLAGALCVVGFVEVIQRSSPEAPEEEGRAQDEQQ